MSAIATFEFAPGLTLAVSGAKGDVGHLISEYRPVLRTSAAAGSTVALRVVFGSAAARGGSPRITGGHKSVGWTATLSAADDPDTTLGIALRGAPRSFARSLVQGYFVEPVLSVVASEAGWVLLPSAGIVTADGLRILVGKSRAGKSTLAARSLATGRTVIGDDQVLVDPEGAWRPYPRRLRFYPDLRYTAPRAWAALPVATRTRLRIRALVASLTRGLVRPSLAVDAGEIGALWDPAPRHAARIMLLERSGDVDEVSVSAGDAAQAQAWAATVLREQRARLRLVDDPAWQARLDAVEVREREILGAAIAGLPVDVLRIPIGWPAPRAVAAAERRLGLGAG